ncbi:MAG: hypothetical protein ACOYIH_07175 [Candidatus Fimadaptatus sp.]|jgi:hypothetical protein
MQSVYFDLLKQWCDALIEHQVRGMGPAFDGAFLCPACKYEHGRCHDAVYPFMYMADRTGDMKYVEAAKAVFDWHENNMMCDDGSAYNDPNAAWNGITVFATTALCEALERHSSLLDEATREKWTDKLSRMANWLYHALNEDMTTNINYLATNAAALALAGKYLGQEAYVEQATHLAAYALERITPNGLLYGEGKPRDIVTGRGCRAIDIGYNVEESIPSLIKYAIATDDQPALELLTDVLRKQLKFMLPDGAWDNSFGSRNNKWTYYGSRTSDGCQAGYALLADRDPAFAEAALRNTLLMRDCSQGGLLHGGVQYPQNGEPACVHHTFTHANAITCALDAGIEKYAERVALPEDDSPAPIQYFPELDTYKLAVGDLRATVTGYDYNLDAGHASGGALTLLWHKKAGPVIAGSVVDYKLVEAHNQQLTLKKARHRSLVPRVELFVDGERYSQCYDTRAVITTSGNDRQVSVKVHASLVTIDQRPLTSPACVKLEYRLTGSELGISGRVYGPHAGKARFVLPVIGDEPRVEVPGEYASDSIFFLTGGFGATEYSICPDADGRFAARIMLPREEK